MTADILTKLRSTITRRKEEQAVKLLQDYQHLVRCLAANQKVDDNQAFVLLSAAGKDMDALEKDVRIFQERRAWAQQIKEAPAARDQIARIESKVQQMQSKLDAIVSQHRKAIDEVRAPLVALEGKVNRAVTARESLLKSLNADPETSKVLQALRARRTELIRPLSRCRSDLWGPDGSGSIDRCSQETLGGRLYELLLKINSDLQQLGRPNWRPISTAHSAFGENLRSLDPLQIENFGWWYSPDHPESARYLAGLSNDNEHVAEYRSFFERKFMPAVLQWIDLLAQEREIADQRQAIFDAEVEA